MNATSINHELSGVLIDQLVANELCETKRTELIQWHEESKERWRDLGLAFLEAQTWSLSFAELEATAPQPTTTPIETGSENSKSLKKLGIGFVLAGSLLVTFLGGVKWADYMSAPFSDHRPLAHGFANDQIVLSDPEISESGRKSAESDEKIKLPVTSARASIRSGDRSEKIKRSLEDRGFAVKTEKRFLPATLPDGRQVMLPFDQMTANYVGKTVY